MPSISPSSTSSSDARLVRVEHVMGTAVGVDVRRCGQARRALDDAFALLRETDRRFSPYRIDSEVSQIASDSVGVGVGGAGLSAEMLEVLALCEEVGRSSGGAFNAISHGPIPRFDPSGLVKGWAIDRAAALLRAAGLRHFCINAGGDVLAFGEPEPGRPWRVGIRHPLESDKVAAVVALRDAALATSGLYERGAHIVDPRTGEVPGELLSVTVVGPALTMTDAYATAAFVKGRAGVPWVAALKGYEAFAVTAGRRSTWTRGFDPLLLRSG